MENTIFSYTTIYLQNKINFEKKYLFHIIISPETFLTTIGLPVRLPMIAMIVKKYRSIAVVFVYKEENDIDASYLYVYLYVMRI